MPEGFPKELEEKLKAIFDDPEIAEKFANIETMSYIDLIINMIKLMLPIMQDKTKLVAFFELIPDLLLNTEKTIIKGEQYDKDLYVRLEKILDTANKYNETKTTEIIGAYIQALQSKYPLDRFLYTIGIFRDILPKLVEMLGTTPLTEYGEKLYDSLFKMIEDNQKERFDYYFFDWTLKFGYLIEAYYKDFLITLLKLIKMLEGKEFESIPKHFLTVGALLKQFEADSTLGIIRNAAVHSDFVIDYQVRLEERKIRFRDWKDNTVTLTIQEFLDTFFNVYMVVNTTMVFFSFYLLKKYKDQIKKGFEPIIQQIQEGSDMEEIQKISFDDEFFDKMRTEMEKLYRNKEFKDFI